MENLVEKYNQAEREGRAAVSNRAIEAFGLEVFGALGYPFKVNDLSGLWRYHDVMHEGRFEGNLKLVKRYTDHEFNLITKTAKQILNFSEHHLPIRNSGKHALMRSLFQYQLMMKNRPHNGLLKILERLTAETKFKNQINWQSANSSPLSIGSSAAIKLGYKPLTTRATLDLWAVVNNEVNS